MLYRSSFTGIGNKESFKDDPLTYYRVRPHPPPPGTHAPPFSQDHPTTATTGDHDHIVEECLDIIAQFAPDPITCALMKRYAGSF